MSTDPAVRLVALHCGNADETIELLFPDGLPRTGKGEDMVEDAILALTDAVEDALCRGVDEVQLDLTAAELLTIELKRRKRKRGHPRKSARAKILRGTTLQYAEDLAKSFREEGHGIEKARSLAAVEASTRAGKSGDHVAASTIERQLKEAAAARSREGQADGNSMSGTAADRKPSRE